MSEGNDKDLAWVSVGEVENEIVDLVESVIARVELLVGGRRNRVPIPAPSRGRCTPGAIGVWEGGSPAGDGVVAGALRECGRSSSAVAKARCVK